MQSAQVNDKGKFILNDTPQLAAGALFDSALLERVFWGGMSYTLQKPG